MCVFGTHHAVMQSQQYVCPHVVAAGWLLAERHSGQARGEERAGSGPGPPAGAAAACVPDACDDRTVAAAGAGPVAAATTVAEGGGGGGGASHMGAT